MRLLFIIFFLIGACTKKQAPSVSSPSLYDEGKSLYLSNCIACHNVDPKVDGALGPAIYGSSKELIESKVLNNAYPESYKPKRETKLMVPIPGLKDKIPALVEYLNH